MLSLGGAGEEVGGSGVIKTTQRPLCPHCSLPRLFVNPGQSSAAQLSNRQPREKPDIMRAVGKSPSRIRLS